MNLSLSDLMFCCFNLPLATSTFWYSSWLYGPLLCRLFPLLRYGLVAVSLFTILAITINRYVMIGHPRLYPKLYRPRYLVLMVLATWVSGFGALVATWFERWGRFGLDPGIGSCSILPDVNGRSPKEFLFILAFLTPCLAIVVCYARIFYIVRKTAMKSRRQNTATANLVKSTLEVKYKKNLDDSALGSSYGITFTTTENGGSPIKSDKMNTANSLTTAQVNSQLNIDSQKTAACTKRKSSICKSIRPDRNEIPIEDDGRNMSEIENKDYCSKCETHNSQTQTALESDERINNAATEDSEECQDARKASDSPGTEIPTTLDVPELRVQDVNNTCSRLINSVEADANNAEENKQVQTDAQTFPNMYDSHDQKLIPNSTSSETDDLQKDQQILNLKNLRNNQNLQKPKSFKQSAERLLSPPILKYEESSEEYASSRSESPCDKRNEHRFNVFRRESRFRSERGRPFETGKMTAKDKKLLKMILVIFSSFLICYLPITITKIFKDVIDYRGLNIAGYILIYLTTCINPVIYVVMSSEYRSAYKNVLLCRSESSASSNKNLVRGHRHRRRKRRSETVQ